METKKVIEEAIQKHQAAVVKINTGCYGVILNQQNTYQISGNNYNSCCGLGCFLIGKENPENIYFIDFLAKSLNTESNWIRGFVRGFDKHFPNLPTTDKQKKLYLDGFNFGKEMSDKYVRP